MLNITKTRDTVTPAIDNIIRTLSQLGKNQILRRAADKFVSMTKSNFGQAGGEYKENRWPSLSKAYAKRVGSSVPTLLRSGNLINSIRVGSIQGDRIGVYTKCKYAAAQNFGNRSTNLPARPFFPMEGKNPNFMRLNAKADRELGQFMVKELHRISNGALPSIVNLKRSGYVSGNPFSRS